MPLRQPDANTPFPSSNTVTAATPGSLPFRPYGTFASDLDIDFGCQRPLLITKVLLQCAGGIGNKIPDKRDVHELPVSSRTRGLLTLLRMSDSPDLNIVLRCRECNAIMEAEIPIESLITGNAVPARFSVNAGGTAITVRPPTGRDQEQWLSMNFENEESGVAFMADSLIEDISGKDIQIPLPAELIEAIDAGLQECDPLVGFTINTSCPACGHVDNFDVDLDGIVLDRFHSLQQQILMDIHHLARYYHWNEQEILAIPPDRRKQYLDLIEKKVI